MPCYRKCLRSSSGSTRRTASKHSRADDNSMDRPGSWASLPLALIGHSTEPQAALRLYQKAPHRVHIPTAVESGIHDAPTPTSNKPKRSRPWTRRFVRRLGWTAGFSQCPRQPHPWTVRSDLVMPSCKRVTACRSCGGPTIPILPNAGRKSILIKGTFHTTSAKKFGGRSRRKT